MDKLIGDIMKGGGVLSTLKKHSREEAAKRKRRFLAMKAGDFKELYHKIQSFVWRIARTIAAIYLFTGPIYNRLGSPKTEIFLLTIIMVFTTFIYKRAA